jgi:two-component system sensor histidine kinase/response regulator
MLKRLAQEGASSEQTARRAGESTDVDLPKSVLVAEDNVVSQQVARRYLEAIGCNVFIVEDGVAAVDACTQQEFGLVLMDLQMPRMDGLQAAQEIRRHERPGSQVPILALTAKAASEELARCTAAGMNGLLTKPLDMTRLRQTLDRYGLVPRALELQVQPIVATFGTAALAEPVDLMTLHAKFSGDAAAVRRLCQSFITSTLQAMMGLDGAVASAERTSVRRLAHKIKSGSTGVYAHRVAALAANIESQAMTATLTELAIASAALRRAFEEACLHVESRLP